MCAKRIGREGRKSGNVEKCPEVRFCLKDLWKRSTSSWQRPMCLTLQQGQILRPRSSSHFISSLCPGSDFHQIFESSSLQTKRIRLLLKDLLNSWTSIGWPFQRFDEVQITSSTNDSFAFSYLLNPFLLVTVLTRDLFFSVYKPAR